jgi:hypothetical protein
MKKLLLQAVAVCALLLPFSTAEAKTFGLLKSGQKIKMVVTERISTSAGPGGIDANADVPDGIPDLKMNKKVTFKISKKGNLTTKKMSLPFLTATSGLHEFFLNRKELGGYKGTIEIDPATKKPTRMVLNFIKREGTTVYTVTYTLN